MQPLEQLQKIDRSQNIEGWNVKIYFLSRNPKVLFCTALGLILIALVAAWFARKPLRQILQMDEGDSKALQAELALPQPSMQRVIELMPQAAEEWLADVPADEWVAKSNLAEAEKMVANALWTSIGMNDGFEPSADLLYFAHYIRPLRFANELVGDHFRREGDLPKAATYYRREAKFPEASTARDKLMDVAVKTRDQKLLREIADDSTFTREFRPEHRLYFAAKDRKWSEVLAPFRELQAKLLKPIPTALALTAGLVWLTIALQSIQPGGILSLRIFLPVIAVAIGMACTFPTLLSGMWVEEVLGLRRGEDMLQNFLYFMGSAGPREELLKLLFTLPLLPVLLIRKSPLETLIVSGCVGLGFAVWENLIYFNQAGPAVAFPRFLTGNFFHLALTGLNGLAFYRLLRQPAEGFLPFVGTLLATILANGAYGFLSSMSDMPVFILGSMIVFMLISLWFFRKLQAFRHESTDQLSIAGTFVVGISLLAGMILVLASHEMGFFHTLATFSITGFGMVMVGYMFYWQLGEGFSAMEKGARPAYYR